MAPSIVLALLGALLFAVSAWLQQRAARHAARTGARRAALLRVLARDRMWRLGWFVNVAGFAAQAAALHLGSIAVVQALLVTQLLFALPLGSAPLGRWPLRRDWLATAAVCVGLAVLLAVRGTMPQTIARRPVVWLIAAGAAVLIVLLVSAARSSGTPARAGAAAVAAAAGVCFC